MNRSLKALIACHDCDLLQAMPPWAQSGHQARWTTAVVAACPRCGAILRRSQKNSLERTIAWLIAGLILYFVAVYFPFLAMQSHGLTNETALISGMVILYQHGMGLMGLVVLLTCLLVPLCTMLSLLYILVPLHFGRGWPYAAPLFAWTQRLRPWGMMEVYLLGILVAMVKLAKMARIIPGPAMFSFIALIFVLAAAVVSLDSHLVWEAFPGPRPGGQGDCQP